MRILLDMDDVICEFNRRVLEWWNQDKGTNVQFEDIKTWELAPLVNIDFLRSCMRYPEFYRDLDPVPGAIEGIKELIAIGHSVGIVTSTPRCAGVAYSGKLEWIRRNMPFFNLDNFISAKKKHWVSGDILFDDGMHNVRPFALAGGKTCLFVKPWNENETAPCFRAKDWPQFIRLIRDLELLGKVQIG